MSHSALITTEKKHDYPILIVDRNGRLGQALAKELKDESLVVYVSKTPPKDLDNVVHIPYLKKFPTIPDNTYSHMFVIDEENQATKEILEAFIKKAKADNSVLVFAFDMKSANEEIISELLSSYENTKIAVFGDVFEKDNIFDSNTDINKFIKQAKSFGKIKIPGDGTRTVSPVYFDDVISGILETVFGAEDNKKIFYIFPKHGITLLSLAHLFKKTHPGLMLDFTKENNPSQKNFVLPIEGVYLLGESYDLEAKIRKIEFENINVSPEEEKKANFGKNQSFGNRSFNLPIIISSFLFFLLLPLISTLLFSAIGAGALYSVKNNFASSDFSSSKQAVSVALNSFSLAGPFGEVLKDEADMIGQGYRVEGLINNVSFGKNVSQALSSLIDAFEKLKAISNASSKNPGKDFSTASLEIKNAILIYNKEKQDGLIPKSIAQKLNGLVDLASTTIDFWPDILGFDGQKTYMVLFQNNMELRPGGGFIGSYGVLTLANGRVKGFKIYDVYDADGQLKAHVEPPFPIRRYLPSIHWFLRDSNFNVDFSKGAVASAVFLNSEMGQTVDGVIGVDLSFVKNILSVTGPVRVTDYNQTVTADNFFQVAQAHAQENFFPGSTQKKDFLNAFYNSLELKLLSAKHTSYLSLLQAISSSIYQKDVLFAFNNVNEQAVFAINGWSSALLDYRTYNDSTINDFTGINEANLGADKVNFYVTRSLSQQATIAADGSVSETLKVTFKNTAPVNSGTSGVYKNYLRFILPLGSTLEGVRINGADLKIIPAVTDPTVYEKKGFVPPNGLEVQKETQGQNTIYGFLLVTQPSQTNSVKIEYTLSQKLNLSNTNLTYSLKIFKQPGVDFFPYDFSLSLPDNLKAVGGSSDVMFDGQKAILSAQITKDRTVNIDLVPQ